MSDKTAPPRLRFCGSGGGATVEEMRDVLRETDLPDAGSAVLVWVCEADLRALARAGVAELVNER